MLTRLCLPLLLICAVQLGAVAAEKPSAVIIGTWGVDIEAMKAEMEAQMEGQDDAAKQMGMQMLENMLGSATFEFTEDQMIAVMMGQRQENSYTVESETDTTLKIIGTDKDGKEQKGTITIIGPDKIELTNEAEQGGGKAMVLIRKPAGSGDASDSSE